MEVIPWQAAMLSTATASQQEGLMHRDEQDSAAKGPDVLLR